MITNPLIIIALLLAIVLVVPMVCRKIRIPSIVGFIIVGCIVGPNGLHLFQGSDAIQALGKIGILYIMLQAGIEVDINDFRYTGPKPRTREASIVMMADSIEAAIRSMKDPTPKAIDQYIERLIRGKLEDGQLSECPLSLSDIDQICSAFSGILKGVYHERIEYHLNIQ